MNIEEYISSGVLEAYVLGELPDREREEVEKNLERYPELKAELSKIEEAQEAFLMQSAIAPRASVKSAIFSKIDSAKPEGRVVSMPAQSSVSIWKYAAAASVALAIISSYMAYNFYSKWKTTESSLATLIAQNQQMAQQYNTVNQRLDQIESDISVINNPAFQRVIMNGTATAPQASAYVYWNASTKEVYLSLQNMKELSKESQYQLWAIVDGKPVDAGVFDGNIATLIKMKDIGAGAVAFAVTVEPRGGKPTPTMDTMQVIGNVVKG